MPFDCGTDPRPQVGGTRSSQQYSIDKKRWDGTNLELPYHCYVTLDTIDEVSLAHAPRTR